MEDKPSPSYEEVVEAASKNQQLVVRPLDDEKVQVFKAVSNAAVKMDNLVKEREKKRNPNLGSLGEVIRIRDADTGEQFSNIVIGEFLHHKGVQYQVVAMENSLVYLKSHGYTKKKIKKELASRAKKAKRS